jgi:hypothetical protein
VYTGRSDRIFGQPQPRTGGAIPLPLESGLSNGRWQASGTMPAATCDSRLPCLSGLRLAGGRYGGVVDRDLAAGVALGLLFLQSASFVVALPVGGSSQVSRV